MKATIELVEVSCANCAMTFAVPERFYQLRRNDHKDFYCPAGHTLMYGSKSEAEKKIAKLEEANERLRKSLDYADRVATRERKEREATERSLSATKGQVTKLRKRAQAGVCPYCPRSFVNMQRHIASKHPGQPLPGEE